jgi:hypothetical protein
MMENERTTLALRTRSEAQSPSESPRAGSIRITPRAAEP